VDSSVLAQEGGIDADNEAPSEAAQDTSEEVPMPAEARGGARQGKQAAASVKKIRIRNDDAKPNDCPTQ
jgi:hypothetical protein